MNRTWPTWVPSMIDDEMIPDSTIWRRTMSVKLRTPYRIAAPRIGPPILATPPRISATQAKNVTSVMKFWGWADWVPMARSMPPAAPMTPPSMSACILNQ